MLQNASQSLGGCPGTLRYHFLQASLQGEQRADYWCRLARELFLWERLHSVRQQRRPCNGAGPDESVSRRKDSHRKVGAGDRVNNLSSQPSLFSIGR